MPRRDESIPKSVTESLLGSGFPFQTAVRNEICLLKGWSIHTSEYPWRGQRDEDRFLDMIASYKNFVLTIECKKTRQDTLTFLDPASGQMPTPQTADYRCLSYQHFTVVTRHQDATCETWAVWPSSPSCEFCIVGTNKSDRLLERDASLIIRATEALIHDVREMSHLSKKLSLPFLFLPVIVTNARLFVAHYKPTDVALDSGEFKELPNNIESAPWVRFSKAYTTSETRDFATRSVFVVGASYLKEFLDNLELAPNQPKDKMPVRFASGAS